MALHCRVAQLARKPAGLVVRPRPGGGPDQTLVFTDDGGVCELLVHDTGDGGPEDVQLGGWLASWGSLAHGALLAATYEPDSDAIYFAPCTATYISRLDASNRISTAAGSRHRDLVLDGVGPQAGFNSVTGLAADGQGGVWVTDGDRIRHFDTRSGEVTTQPAAVSADGSWWTGLAFDAAGGRLLAALPDVTCRHVMLGMPGAMVLVAGRWRQQGRVDGRGVAARFCGIQALLPVPGGRLLIADGPDLRCMDAGGAVTTLLRDCFPFAGSPLPWHMALLPNGELGVVMADGRTPGQMMLVSDLARSSQPPPSTAVATDRLLSLLAPQAAEEGGEYGSSAAAPALTGTVTVRVGDRAFPAHRSVLAASSEYFARLLAPGGGFAESGAAEVSLPDADPAAFAHLLSYMYGASLGAPSPAFDVPPELRRPTAALAGRLLMGGGAVAALAERLAAAVTPASVLSDLAWADAHGITDLVGRFSSYAVAHRKALAPSGLEALVMQSPTEAAKLLAAFAQA